MTTAARAKPRYRRCRAVALTVSVAMASVAWVGPASAAAATSNANNAGNSAIDYSDKAVQFNTRMLAGSHTRQVDLSRFENPNVVAPGTYNIDVFLNGSWVGRSNVRFAAPKPGSNAVPCMTSKLAMRMQLPGIDEGDRARMDAPRACVTLQQLVDGATTKFDMGRLRLDATVPQAYLSAHPRGYVNPDSWDPGLTAFFLNYNLNAFRASNSGSEQTSSFLGINAGLNLGLWHFRQDSTWTHTARSGAAARTHWHNLDTYVSRDIPAWRARVIVGDSHTDGAVFNSYGIRGIQLATVDAMLPQSRRGYAPVIRGVASSNAKVEVTRDGQVIYQTTVTPGPFTIDDLYPTSAGGDLAVTVTEADGQKHTFDVPYASIEQLVRPGIFRFDFAAGQLRNLSIMGDKPQIIRGTAQYGFNNLVTGYAGFQGTNGYAAAVLGAAFNTRIGAFSADLTEAGITLPNYPAHTGQSLRLTWSRAFPATHTNINVAAYRYSTRGFLDLTDAVAAREYARTGVDTWSHLGELPRLPDGTIDYTHLTAAQQAALDAGGYDPIFDARGLLHNRNRFTVAINQPLGKGSLYANASFTDYWNRGGTNRQYQVGYANRIGRLNWSLSVSRTYNLFRGAYEDKAYLSLNLPLGRAAYAPNLMFTASHDDRGNNTQQASLSGTAGRGHQYSYGASVNHADRGGHGVTSGSINAGYTGSHFSAQATAAAGTHFNQQSAGIRGGILVSHAGVDFTQTMGDTVALVHAPGATGARIANAIGLHVGKDGYAVLPYLQPYQRNDVRIDPQGTPLGVELDSTTATVAPYGGAVVQVDFKTTQGRPMVVRITRVNGKPVPFGSEVFGSGKVSLGIVGQAGVALLRGVEDQGHLTVRWNDAESGAAHACAFTYTAPAGATSAYQQVPVTCKPSGGPSQPTAMSGSTP